MLCMVASVREFKHVIKAIRDKDNYGQDSSVAESQKERSKFSKPLIYVRSRLVATAIGAVIPLAIYQSYNLHRVHVLSSFVLMGWMYPVYLWVALVGIKKHFMETPQQRKSEFRFIVLGFLMMSLSIVTDFL